MLSRYEFLHTSFGEFLVARWVVNELGWLGEQARRAAGDPYLQPPDDTKLRALLSVTVLSTREGRVLEFVGDLLSAAVPAELDALRTLLLALYRTCLRPPRTDPYPQYRPVPQPEPAWRSPAGRQLGEICPANDPTSCRQVRPSSPERPIDRKIGTCQRWVVSIAGIMTARAAAEGHGRMPVSGSPTGHRRELGVRLRSFRRATNLTTGQVAQLLGISRSKISRLENGRRGASQADIARLCDLYQVDGESRSQLSDLAAEGKRHPWWQPSSLPYADYIGLEAAAESISDYGLALVPGLLQTADYARATVLAGGPRLSPEIVEERVRARIARQRLLSSEEGPSFTTVLDESVLHRVVGSPTVMLEQLRRLLELSRLPRVTVRVVPYDAGIVPSGVGKFIILQFAKPDVDDVVLIEDLTVHRYLDRSGDVATYRTVFDTLIDLSVDPDASTSLIREKLIAYELRIR